MRSAVAMQSCGPKTSCEPSLMCQNKRSCPHSSTGATRSSWPKTVDLSTRTARSWTGTHLFGCARNSARGFSPTPVARSPRRSAFKAVVPPASCERLRYRDIRKLRLCLKRAHERSRASTGASNCIRHADLSFRGCSRNRSASWTRSRCLAARASPARRVDRVRPGVIPPD